MQTSGRSRGLLARLGCVVVAAGAAVLLVNVGSASAASAATPTPQTSFSFTSAPGDYIGGGQSKSYESPSTIISASGNTNEVNLAIHTADYSDWWYVTLAAPVGEQFYPGTYLNAERASFRTGRAPGIDINGEGRGCNNDYGQFTIYQIGYDSSGNLSTLDASFEQHCESPTAPALTGTVRYQALPLDYSFTSSPGDYIGQGQSKTYYNDTSTFSLTGTTSGISYGVSGLGDGWTVDLAPPTGQTFQVGQLYDNAQRFASATNPEVQLYGDGRGCNADTGSFVISDLATDSSGNVTNLAATFSQSCDGGPALNGTIQYLDGSFPQTGTPPATARRVRAS
jgi:hypothetical protein